MKSSLSSSVRFVFIFLFLPNSSLLVAMPMSMLCDIFHVKFSRSFPLFLSLTHKLIALYLISRPSPYDFHLLSASPHYPCNDNEINVNFVCVKCQRQWSKRVQPQNHVMAAHIFHAAAAAASAACRQRVYGCVGATYSSKLDTIMHTTFSIQHSQVVEQ